MTVLEDAQRLNGFISSQCDFCTGSPTSGHFDGCPLLSIPKIVAALEVLDRHGLLGVSEHVSEKYGLVLDLHSDCLCFSEPVLHRDDCERKVVPTS